MSKRIITKAEKKQHKKQRDQRKKRRNAWQEAA